MRPSPRLLAVALVLTGLCLVVLLAVPGGAGWLVPAWAGLVLVALADAGLALPPRAVSVAFGAPSIGYTGQTARATLTVTAPRPLPAGLTLRLTADTDLPDLRLDAPQPAPLVCTLDIPLTRRGPLTVTGAALMWPSRLGLWEMLRDVPLGHVITVVPDISPVLSGQITTRMLPLMAGQKDMRLKGDGSEFHQLRDFAPGMDPRSIDWKRSARMRSLVARETRAERNHQIILGLDSGHLMAERIGGLPKLDRAINAALAMAWAGGLGGDMVGLYSFDSRPRLFLPPAPGRAAFPRLQAACAALAQEAAETNHTLALSHLHGRLKRRSLVILFSDFADAITAELLVENTAILARHHLVLYVALRDPALQALAHPADPGPDAIAMGVAAGQMLHERASVLERLSRLGVLCLDTTPEGLTPALISRYIDIKSRELI
ncbi:DUF58 domain-containing protein [Gemmobacter sp.]|uniref:DUF58 domain-containing protein n=1 Tax=Gemmobacter sp. TaxID=1898957 RepID=UPI002AFE6F07|nr:DUF58 domain-containing protein [Gemmobacter sp.]